MINKNIFKPILFAAIALAGFYFNQNAEAACGDACGTGCHCEISGAGYRCTATDATRESVSATFTEAASSACTAPITIVIPRGSVTWGSALSITLAKNTKVIGAGTDLSSGTVITGATANNILTFSVNAGISFDLSGLRLVAASGAASNGVLSISGQSQHITIHDMYFDTRAVTTGRGLMLTWANGTVPTAGVVYNNTFAIHTAGQGIGVRPNINFPLGGESVLWGQAAEAAGREIWYIEGNTFIRDGGAESMVENYAWARSVVRHNDMVNGHVATHGWDSDVGPPNMTEIYANKHTGNSDNAGYMEGIRGGVGLIWGNTYDATYNYAIGIVNYRSGIATFGTDDNPVRTLEYTNVNTDTFTVTGHRLVEREMVQLCGPGTEPAPLSSVCTSSGQMVFAKNVTADTFQVSETPGGTALDITGAHSGTINVYHGQCDGNNAHDENSDSTGYHCKYSPGTTGVSGTDHYPLYQFLNIQNGDSVPWTFNVNFTHARVKGDIALDDHLISNRDYFTEDTVYCPARVNADTSCTKGIGVGTKAQRPDRCSNGDFPGSYPGPAWWATDEQTLYLCSSADTWTPVYTPYTCPHPLTGLTGTCDPDIAGRAGYDIGGTDITPPAAPGGLTVN